LITATADNITEAALTFQTNIETRTLWRGAYSPRQEALYALIVGLKNEGLGYRRIAKLLNIQGIPTARRKFWSSPSVHSVIKKGRIREERGTIFVTLGGREFDLTAIKLRYW
jgi:hypothetical protein